MSVRVFARVLCALVLAAEPALAADGGRAIHVALVAEDGGAPRAGEPAAVTVRVQDPASGFPLTGLTPALWLLPLADGAPEEGCAQRVNRLAGAAMTLRGAVDVNGFDLIQATADGRLALVDPLLNLASANLRGVLDLGEVPAAWALEPGGRVLAAATAGDRRLHRIDLAGFSHIEARALPAEPVSMVASAGEVWTGLSDGSVLASRRGRLVVGQGPVQVAATPLGIVALSASGQGAFLRAGAPDVAVDIGTAVRALGYAPLADSGYALSADGRTLRIFPQDDPRASRSIVLPRPMRALAVAPEGRWIALVADDGAAVSILDMASDRLRWTIDVRDPVIAADFSDAFLYLMHARQGGASRVVFDPDGGPPAVVTIAAGSNANGEQRAGTLPLLARIPSAGMLLASSRDRQAFMVNDDSAHAAMSSLPLRAGEPAGILLRYRGLEPDARERGVYRADVVLSRGGGYVAVVRTERPSLAHCARLAVAPADGEPSLPAAAAEAPAPARRLDAGIVAGDDGDWLAFSIDGPSPALLQAASLVGDGWQHSPREVLRDGRGYRMRIDGARTPFTLFVRYRDRMDGPAHVLVAPVSDRRSAAR